MAYSQEEIDSIFNSICLDIESGMSLRAALNKDNRPSSRTFFNWVDSSSEKVKQYARATEQRADSIFEDILSIADNQEDDIIVLDDGKEVPNHNVIQRARLRVDSRKWMLGKMNPKKYGDKLDLTVDEKRLSPEEREARIQELLAKAKGNE